MPTYEYECLTCKHQFEVVQSMKDPHLKDCPQAGCPGPIRRKIGRGAGIIFKGTGFYETDYRSDSYKAAAKKDTGDAGSASTPAAAPAPSAPAPAPAAAPPPASSSSGSAA